MPLRGHPVMARVSHAELSAFGAQGCEPRGMAEESEWTLIGELKTPDDTASDDVQSLVSTWLAERGIERQALADDDLRIDLSYLGPGQGCDMRVSVRTIAFKTQ